jgi:hypothetical protein
MESVENQINTLTQKQARVFKEEREEAFGEIRSFLRNEENVSAMFADSQGSLNCRKLWRGLLSAFWLTDKRPVQQEFADQLALLVHSLSDEYKMTFLDAFWTELQIQWQVLDKWRLSKYMSLCRFAFREMARWLVQCDMKFHEEYNELMSLNVLLPDTEYGVDIQLHLIQLFLTEISQVDDLEIDHVAKLLVPFFDLLGKSDNPSIKANMEDYILSRLLEVEDDDDKIPSFKRMKALFSDFSQKEDVNQEIFSHWYLKFCNMMDMEELQEDSSTGFGFSDASVPSVKKNGGYDSLKNESGEATGFGNFPEESKHSKKSKSPKKSKKEKSKKSTPKKEKSTPKKSPKKSTPKKSTPTKMTPTKSTKSTPVKTPRRSVSFSDQNTQKFFRKRDIVRTKHTPNLKPKKGILKVKSPFAEPKKSKKTVLGKRKRTIEKVAMSPKVRRLSLLFKGVETL